MKRSQTIVLIAVGAAVLITAVGIGFYIKEARRNKQGGSEAGANVGGEHSVQSMIPPTVGREKFYNLSEEERAKIVEERKKATERWATMSDEEKQKFREQLRERFDISRQGDRGAGLTLSEEEKTKLRERWANMTEQERQQFRDKIREELRAKLRDPNAVRREPNIVGQEPNTIINNTLKLK
jgi:hypothetical protein